MPTRRTWSRVEPLMGVAAVVLWAAAWEVWSSGGKPTGDYQTTDIVNWFDDSRWTIFAGAGLYALGAGAFIWFLACLRDALAVGEWAERLTRVVFGAGVATVVLLCCSFAPSVAGAGTFAFGDKRGISPSAAEALYALTNGFVVPAEFLSVFLFLPAGLIAIRAGVLPVWLGTITLLLAALLLVLPIGFVGIIFLMPLWTVVTAIMLTLRARTTPPL